MNELAAARAKLHAAIAGALPGRVNPYPLGAAARPVAPYIWIEVPQVIRETIGRATRIVEAIFPVWVIYNGTVEAQVAGLDDTVAAVWDACEATPGVEPRSALPREVSAEHQRQLSPGQIAETPITGVWRASVVSAAVTITARTLCPPQPSAAEIPPTPISTVEV